MTERQIFAIYDEDGNYNGFYPTDIWDIDKIPTENRIELTYDEWQEGIHNRCKVVNGKHTIDAFTSNEHLQIELESIRLTRIGLLQQSDWTQFNDSPLSVEKKTQWATYRQSLRDITNTVPYVLPKEPI
tara:strand:+ start:914 stop:1300 length:387 start_codon:yes stop_codon:yes gene_type:complete